MRWQTQEMRRHDRFAGYVYTELADVEHEMAGLVDADRRPKDLGGLDPADVNADTVLVLDLLPRQAGADLPVPSHGLILDVHVSHHGTTPVVVWARATWVPAGAPFCDVAATAAIESEPVKAEPFVLSPAVTLTVPAPGPVDAARLHVWLVDEAGRTVARSFIDAGPIEAPNRRGARET